MTTGSKVPFMTSAACSLRRAIAPLAALRRLAEVRVAAPTPDTVIRPANTTAVRSAARIRVKAAAERGKEWPTAVQCDVSTTRRRAANVSPQHGRNIH